MEAQPKKALSRDFFSVTTGVVAGFGISTLIILFLFTTGIAGWSDGGEAEYLRTLERNTIIGVSVAMAVGAFFAGFITARISWRKTMIPSLATTAILVLIYFLLSYDPYLPHEKEDYVNMTLIFLACCLGGFVGLSTKRKNTT